MPDSDASRTTPCCYRCGASLIALSLPLSRLDTCPDCSVELHVCRMCTNYAPSAPDACSEEDAIEVHNKTSANFCDYFNPASDAFDGRERRAENVAKRELDALFGGAVESAKDFDTSTDDDPLLRQAEDLFGK